MSADRRLSELGLILPPPTKPVGNYVPYRIGGNLLFLSGVGPRGADGVNVVGKVGADLTVAQAYEAARLCGLNLLANMRSALGGSLDRVDTVLKVFGMVNAVPEFGEQPEVINGCTDLFVQGETGVDYRNDAGAVIGHAGGYGTLNLRADMDLGNDFSLVAEINNITDRSYKPYDQMEGAERSVNLFLSKTF